MLLGGMALARPQTNSQVLDLTKVKDTETRYCTDEEGGIAYAASTASLLALYGINTIHETWVCYNLEASWLQRGKAISLRKVSPQVDSHGSVTLLTTDRDPHLWIIPVATGMVEYPCLPNDIHNIAAFNALLAENSLSSPTPETYLALAVFYLNLIGMQTHFADWNENGMTIHGLKSSPDFFHKKSLQPSVEYEPDGCTVTVNDAYSTAVTQAVTVWELFFRKTRNQVRLDSVERENKPLSEFP